MKVTLEHLHTIPGFGARPGFCHGGARPVFAQLGLDWNEFRRHGLDADRLTATGHPLALALVAHARKREAEHGQS